MSLGVLPLCLALIAALSAPAPPAEDAVEQERAETLVLIEQVPENEDAARRLLEMVEAGRLRQGDPLADVVALGVGKLLDQRAVGVVMRQLAAAQDQPTIHRITKVLSCQTGLEFGDDVKAWQAWWREAMHQSRLDWYRELARRQAELSRKQAAALGVASQHVNSAYRRLYAQLEDGARMELLLKLMRDEAASMRVLALELAMRSLLNAATLSPEVIDEAALRLDDGDRQVRSLAARLLEQAAPARLAHRADDLLQPGQVEEVAIATLRAVTLHPEAAGASLPLRPWIQRGLVVWREDGEKSLLEASSEAAAQLLLHGQWRPAPPAITEMMDNLRELTAEDRCAGVIVLLALLWQQADAEALLLSASEAAARAAAAMLAAEPSMVEPLVEAAKVRPALLSSAVESVRRHNATPDGLAQVEQLTMTLPTEERTAWMIKIATAMSQPDLLVAMREREDPAVRRLLLAHLVQGPALPVNGAGPMDADAETDSKVRDQLLLMLAEAQLAGGAGGAAIQALDQRSPGSAADAAAELRCVGLLLQANFAEVDALAVEQTLGPELWLRACELAGAAELRHAIAAAAIAQFGAELTSEQLKQLKSFELPAPLPAAPPATSAAAD